MEELTENGPGLHNLEEFQKNETLNVRSQLANLNCKDLRQYFRGFKSIYNELQAKKEEFEVEEIVYREELNNKKQDVEGIKKSLSELKMTVKAGKRTLEKRGMKF
uniref:Uncharacterized protein n=1 Tax=Ditylenchus dipsaci TaxID=166011 RepID=A0A915CPB2_9BILA